MKKPFLRTALWAAIILGAATACTKDHATVHLNIEGATEAIVVRIEGDHSIPWDTIAITDGTLNLSLPVDSTLQTFYYLVFNSGGTMRLGIQPGDELNGHVDARTALTAYTLTGSPLSEQLLTLYTPVLRSSTFLDSLDADRQMHLRDSTEAGITREKRNYSALEVRYLAHRREIMEAMQKDSSNLANVFGFFQQVGQVSLFTPGKDLPMLESYAAVLSHAHQNHPLAQIFAQEVTAMRQLLQLP